MHIYIWFLILCNLFTSQSLLLTEAYMERVPFWPRRRTSQGKSKCHNILLSTLSTEDRQLLHEGMQTSLTYIICSNNRKQHSYSRFEPSYHPILLHLAVGRCIFHKYSVNWHDCNVVTNSDPVIRTAVVSFGIQRVTLVQFWIGKAGHIERSVYYGRNGLKSGILLYPDYHSLRLIVFCTQQQFKFVLSDHP